MTEQAAKVVNHPNTSRYTAEMLVRDLQNSIGHIERVAVIYLVRNEQGESFYRTSWTCGGRDELFFMSKVLDDELTEKLVRQAREPVGA